MYCYFWNFEKKINSTKQPADEESTPFNITLKDGCSIVTPIIEVAAPSPQAFNYAYIPSFNRYYFVNDWTYERGVWVCSMSVDVLASYREAILLTKQYVSRSDNNVTAANVLDVAPLTLTTSEQVTKSGGAVFSSGENTGFFIVGIVGPNSTMGAVNYYYFSDASKVAELTQLLMGDVDWLSVPDISDELTKCLVNPMQYIVSCKFFPFSITVGYKEENIKLGFWDTGIKGGKLTSFSAVKLSNVGVPKHPQAGTLGNFTNLSPYSNYTFEFEPFGVFPLDAVKLANVEDIALNMAIDLVTGECALILESEDGAFIAKQFSKICVDIPIGATSNGLLGIAAGVVGQTVGGIVREHVSGDLANSITGVTNTIMGASSSVAVKGSHTSRAFMTEPPKIHAHFQRIGADYTEVMGHACCKVLQLGTLAGYNLVVKPRISISGTRGEQESVIQFMEGGFFIE